MWMVLQEEGWVVCRAFKKRTSSTTTQSRMTEAWDSTFCYDEPSSTGVGSVMDSIDNYLPQNNQQSSFICKQEIETMENLNNYLHQAADPFVQLPQLQSPSLPLIKKPRLASMASESEEEYFHGGGRPSGTKCNNINYMEKVTDWRTLDRFVASQLSEGDQRYDRGGGMITDEVGIREDHSDMAALLLLQSSREVEGNKLNGLLSSSSTTDCDHFGICIFEK